MRKIGHSKQIFFVALLTYFILVHSAGAEMTGKIWKPRPLRTQAQDDRNMFGGQGMQKIFNLRYAPSDPGIAYMVSDTSGVWRGEWSVVGKDLSGNDEYGFFWESKRGYYDEALADHKGFRAFGGFSIGVDPVNPDVVFVSGSNHRKESYCDTHTCPLQVEGIYRTQDGGGSWERVKNTSYYQDNTSNRNKQGQHFVFDLSTCSGNSCSTIYAGTHEDGLLKSENNGDSWQVIGLQGVRILDMELNNERSGHWYPVSGWTHRQAITIKAGITSKVLRDFPILVKLEDQLNPLFDHAQNEGGDILFTRSDGVTKLDHEIEHFDKTSGMLEAWVRIPTLTSTSDTVIYMYYGNNSAPDQQNKTGVWDENYLMVQHLDESPDDGNEGHIDSTMNSKNCSPQDFQTGGNGSTDTQGKIGGADEFDGVTNPKDYLDCGDEGLNFDKAFTVEVWFNSDNWSTGVGKVLAGKYDNNSGVGRRGWYLGRSWTESSELKLGIFSGSQILFTAGSITDGVWTYAAGIFDGEHDSMQLMVNDNFYSRNAAGWQSFTPASGSSLTIGKSNVSNDFFTGNIDEVRISTIVRSEEWLQASYTIQNSPENYLVFGTEETSSSFTSSDRIIIYVATVDGLYKVIDDIVSSSRIDNLQDYPRSIALDPQSSSRNDIIYAAAGIDKVWKSDDGGETFVLKSSGLPNLSGKEYKIIDVSKADPNHLYVTVDGWGGKNPFYSNDGGESWKAPTDLNVDNLHMVSGTYDSSVFATHPEKPDTALCALSGGRIMETVDGGETWRYSGSGYMGPESTANKTSTFFDPDDSAHIVRFLLDWGPAVTTDFGLTWNLMLHSDNRPYVNPNENNKLIAPDTRVGAVGPNGTVIIPMGLPGSSIICMSNDGGSSWKVFDGFDGDDANGNTHTSPDTSGTYDFMMFNPDQQYSNIVYAGQMDSSWISQDSGNTWSKLDNLGIRAVSKDGSVVYAFEACYTTGCNTSVLWRFEENSGKNIMDRNDWDQVGTNPFRSNVYDVDVDPQNSSRLYAARGDENNSWAKGGIWVFDGTECINSSDGCDETDWEETGVTTGQISSEDFGTFFSVHNVVVDPNDSNNVYIGMWVPSKGYRKGYIYRSIDSGQTWEDISGGLGKYSKVSSLAVDPSNSVLYVRMAHGLYVLCTDEDGDTYATEGGVCGPVDVNDSDSGIVSITDLSAKVHNRIKLQWTCANAVGSYNIYRSTVQGGQYNLIASDYENDGCNYLDSEIASGSTYFYVVRFINSNGQQSLDSNEVSAVY